MTRLQCLPLALFMHLSLAGMLSSEPLTYTINTKKWTHVLDEHFISVTVNPTDLLQGKAFGLGMNSTVAILKGLSPAYIRVGSADTGKYAFKRSRYSNDAARTEDEMIVTESHWMIVNDVAQSAGLDVVVCLNAAHRNGVSRKWDTRNSLELISFSDSQGYNLTFQLGYEVQRTSGLSGHQYGKDVNRLRTILNAFPRYQHSKLIGPDIKILHKKEDVEFVNDVLLEAGHTLDAVTWHPRWPQPSKMKVSDNSELGYEFPSDYIEWDKSQLHKVLQRSISKTPIWIGEPKTESTGTFAEGLLWARRLVLAAKLGIEVVMKQPSLMDISHPKPEYWIAFLHKRLLGRSVLETRAMNNQSEIAIVTHCTNPLFWTEKPDRSQEGSVTVFAVNMGGKEQRIHMKGTWSGKSQIMFQYLLTSGSDPDSVFSQMTYLNGEPLMMTDDGNIPEILPRIRKVDRGVIFKLPPYSVGYWVVPEARVKICQVQPASVSQVNFENLSSSTMLKNPQRSMPNIRNVNQFIVDKLKNPISESEEEGSDEEVHDGDSSERTAARESGESRKSRSARRVRQVTVEDIGEELKEKITEIRDMLENKDDAPKEKKVHKPDMLRTAEEKITSLTDELGSATRMTDQQEEFGRFLHRSGLNQDFGALMMGGRMSDLSKAKRRLNQAVHTPKMEFPQNPPDAKLSRFRRSLSYPEDEYEEEESVESYSSEEGEAEARPNRQINYSKGIPRLLEDSYEGSGDPGFNGPPALKSLEERYKTYISNRIQDGKRKLNDIRRMKQKNETEESKKSDSRKGNALGSDLQEEILMKEVEVLQKTEEAMANLIKNHKKRQQTIEEIILHEITDIKEDRLSALEDMRNHKEIVEQTNANLEPAPEDKEIPKKMRRSVLNVLQKKINYGPQSRQKAKRSIQGVDSSVNNLSESSLEERKSKVVKRSVDASDERSFRRRKSGRSHRTEDGDDNGSVEDGEEKSSRKNRSERLERMKNFIQSRERIRDRNVFKKKSRKSNRKNKPRLTSEESNEIMDKYGIDLFGTLPEEPGKNVFKETVQKPEKKMTQDQGKHRETQGIVVEVENTKQNDEKWKIKGDDKRTEITVSKGTGSGGGSTGGAAEGQKSRLKTEEKKYVSGQGGSGSSHGRATSQRTKSEEKQEYVPLKIDKNRGVNVLKRISNLVETINTKERAKSRNPAADMDDLSEEFYGDTLSKVSKRRHRRSHHRDGEGDQDTETAGMEATGDAAESNPPDMKTFRKEMKIRRLLDRLNRRKKLPEGTTQDQGEEVNRELHEKISKSRSRIKNSGKSRQPTTEAATAGTDSSTDEPIRTVEQTEATDVLQGTASTDVPDMKRELKGTDDKQKSDGQLSQPLQGEKNDSGNEESQGDTKVVELSKPTENVTPMTSHVDKSSVADPGEFQDVLDPRTVLVVPEMAEGIILSDMIASSAEDEEFQQQPVEAERTAESEEAETEETSNEMSLLLREGEETFPFREEDEYREKWDSTLLRSETEGDDLGDSRTDQQFALTRESLNARKEEDDESPEDSDEDESISGQMKKRSLKSSQHPLTDSSQREQYETGMVQPTRNDPAEASQPEKTSLSVSDPEDVSSDANFATSQQLSTSSVAGSVDTDIADPTIMKAVPEETFFIDSENDGGPLGEAVPSEKETKDFTEEEEGEEGRPLRRARRGILDGGLFSPEDRMRNFRRTMHRRHSPFKQRNELPLTREGDNFWKVAGSTVKAVFDDVIPDAYGKTKDKIENLGIAEYFKEFGKIVEQMKNLDRIFANIGEAAVKNYLQGSEDEKSDYIQVIGKTKRRSRRDLGSTDPGKDATAANAAGIAGNPVENILLESNDLRATPAPQAVPQGSDALFPKKVDFVNEGLPPAGSGQPADDAPPGKKPKSNTFKHYIKDGPNDLIRNIFLMDSNPGIVEVTKSPPTAEPQQTLPLQPFHSRYVKPPRRNPVQSRLFQRDTGPKSLANHNRSFLDRAPTGQEMEVPQLQKFSPWMRTTKDFINQALTTLQRQRELSEMIARESVNDLVKREIEKKVIGKREIFDDGSAASFFPVYQVPSNRKREIYGSPEENRPRYLGNLQPGVYIVPTEEMKNLRSEQIMKEAPSTKPGMPNIVTLNIYYDKKKPHEWDASPEEGDAPNGKINPNLVRYYQTPGAPWSPIPVANHPAAAEYIPPMQETAIENRYLPPLQGIPAYRTEAKIQEPINHNYPDWVDSTPRSYSPMPRSNPAAYDRLYYLPEEQFGQQRSDWSDFRVRHSAIPEASTYGHLPASDSGWTVQFQPTKKKTLRNRQQLKDRYNRLYADKKRSIGSGGKDSNFSELALPFWKYFAAKKEDDKDPREAAKNTSEEGDSLEEIFEEKRKRAKQNGEKQSEAKSDDSAETEQPAEESQQEADELERRRRRRDAPRSESPEDEPRRSAPLREGRSSPQISRSLFHQVERGRGIPKAENGELARSRRSPDETVKVPVDDDRQQNDVAQPNLKSATDRDSSLEVPAKEGGPPETSSSSDTAASSNEHQVPVRDDALTSFFKYAYDSLIQMMKGMTGL